MDVLGRRMSRSGVLHLIQNETENQGDWITVCGRKINRSYALPTETFDGGDKCCAACKYKRREVKL
jgi:hypothetical protein